MTKNIFLLAFAVILCGCSTTKKPAPIEYNHSELAQNYSSETISTLKEEGTIITNNSFNEPQESLLVEDDNTDNSDFALPKDIKNRTHKTVYHEVQENETIEDIARMYGQKASSIAALNHINSPYHLEEFQVVKIKVPSNFDQTSALNTPAKPTKTRTKIKKTVHTAYIKPVSGKIISRFGEKNSSGKNKGINISAPKGAKIVASTSGKVLYADYDATFGYLLFIKSNGKNVITSYAHLEDIAVSKGQSVKQGEIIGYVGDTGKVDSPQLNFGIRVGKTAKNPLNYVKY